MKALLDTNIILDIALERESFFDDVLMLFKLIDTKKIVAFVTATTYSTSNRIDNETPFSSTTVRVYSPESGESSIWWILDVSPR